MNYKSDKVFSNQEFFTYIHNLEVLTLFPMKNKLTYDDLTEEERTNLLECYDKLKTKIDNLNMILKNRTNEPKCWEDSF